LTLRNADSGAWNCCPQEVQAAMQGIEPISFTMRTKRFRLSRGDMVNILQDGAGHEAKNEPKSSLEHCLKSGRHNGNHVTDPNVG
jgi:hypothetical protein